jgi:hypothetical protein
MKIKQAPNKASNSYDAAGGGLVNGTTIAIQAGQSRE